MAPEAALARQPFLEDVARAGDFAVYRDRDAARVSMVLSAWADGRGGMAVPADYAEQTGLLYGHWAPRLSELGGEIDRHRELWAAEDETLSASEVALASGTVTVTERPDVDLAIVDVAPDAPDAGGHRFGGEWVAGLHPMAVHNATERLVVATAAAGATTSSCATSRGCSCARARCACAATSPQPPVLPVVDHDPAARQHRAHLPGDPLALVAGVVDVHVERAATGSRRGRIEDDDVRVRARASVPLRG